MNIRPAIDPRRQALSGDRQRPAYHFLAPAAWMNDPNGPIYWRGKYHLFYQYNPTGAFWHDPCWGHAVSDDLVHWQDLPPALVPEPGQADEHGCFSGMAFLDKQGTPTIIYYGNPHGVCIATSNDDLLVEWTKHPANPVIRHPLDPNAYQVFDPCAWLEGDTYYAITGGIMPKRPKSILSDGRDVAFLFRSTDLEHWEYRHPFYESSNFTEGGEDCAVPDFFPFGDKHMLIFCSHTRAAQFYTGSYRDERFIPERHQRLAFSETARVGVLGEGLTLLDDRGRRIFFGRISEGRFGHVQRASGWSGILALPMLLSPGPDGEVMIEPVPELAALRRDHIHLVDLALPANTAVDLPAVRGDQLEIRAVFAWSEAEEFGLAIRRTADGQEETLIRVNTNPWTSHRPQRDLSPTRELILDVTRSSTSPDVSNRESQRCLIDLPYGRLIELRLFIDRSVVELFANRRHYLSKRIYPAAPDSLGVRAYAVGGEARLVSLDAWRMQAIWPTSE